MATLVDTVRHHLAGYMKSSALAMIQHSLKQGRINLVIETTTEPQTIHLGLLQNTPQSEELEVTVTLANDSDFWLNIYPNLDLGFAEAYMSQALDCDDLVKLCRIYIQNWKAFRNTNSVFAVPVSLWTKLFRPTNTMDNALHNASFHYDISNELFAGFLSAEMTYSCPIWRSQEDSLEDAQRRKVHEILRLADITSHHHILDIGGGWGYLAIEAARLTGCRVTAITLSKEQKAFAEKSVRAESLDDRITFLLCDYRECPKPPGGYDRIVSVEMIEAVGREFLDSYFRALHNLLNPTTGRVVIQTTTFCEQLHKPSKSFDNFIDRYIFPGCYFPTVTELVNSLHRGSDAKLELEHTEDTSRHYVKAFRLWRERFIANWDTIRLSLGRQHGAKSDRELEATKRKWIYYFSYCQAGYHGGILGNVILAVSRKPRPMPASSII